MTWFLAVVALLGVSASGPLMAATAAPALVIAFWRNAAATAVLAPFAVRRRADLAGLRWRDLRGTVFAGLMLAVHFAAWVGALKLTTVAAATALTCTQLVWVVAIDRLRGVRPGRRVVVGCTVASVGVLVVSGVDFTVSSRALLGDLLAIVGGLGAALYLVAGEGARRRLTTTTRATTSSSTTTHSPAPTNATRSSRVPGGPRRSYRRRGRAVGRRHIRRRRCGRSRLGVAAVARVFLAVSAAPASSAPGRGHKVRGVWNPA